MPRLPQAPPPGIARNATPEATPNRWFDGNNIRWRGGILQPIGGNVLLPGTTVSDTPRDLITWHDNTYTRWAAFGTDSTLWAFNFATATLYNITPTGVGPLEPPGALVGFGLGDYGMSTYGTARDPADIGPQDIAAVMGDKWSMDTFGDLLLVVPTQDGHLYVWDPTTPATPAVVVPEAPVMNRGVVVTDQRQVVLIGSGGDPRMVAWSDQESIHVWTPDVTNLAGSNRLVTQAYVLTALKVPSGVLIFTSNDLHMMTYNGPPYAYGIIQIGAACGPISHRAPVAIGNYCIWPSLDGFWAFTGQTAMPFFSDVQDWFYSMINRTMGGRIFGSPNPPFAEIWWDWPDEGATECNRYIAVNYNPQAASVAATYSAPRPWIIGQRARTAGDLKGTMDYPILAGLDPTGAGGLFLHEYGWLSDGASRAANGEVYAESGAILLGEGDNRYNVTQVVFDAVTDLNNPAFGLRFFTREQPFTDDYDTGLYTDIGSNGLMDVRFSGRSVRMRVEATQDQTFALGRLRLEAKPAGRR